jgi:hypothetical protein
MATNLTQTAQNIERAKTVEDGIWADLEAGDTPPYRPGHAIYRFRENLIEELAARVSAKDFNQCLERASDALPRHTSCASEKI